VRPDVTLPVRAGTRGVIFDLDDTLYAHETFVHSGFEALAHHVEARHGIPAGQALETLRRARREGPRGRELQVLCEVHGLPGALVPQLRNVIRAHTPRLRLPAESLSALARLRADGWRLVVLTNGRPSIQRAKVAALGLPALVHHVVYADEHSRGGKPAPRPFREALCRLGVSADNCVCVGDDPVNDIVGARRLGIRTVRIHQAGGALPLAPDADAVVSDMIDVPATLLAVLAAGACNAA
jgi:putative hydrolase of the HAD superfamily